MPVRRLLVVSAFACALALPAVPASAASCAGADTTISSQSLSAAKVAVLCIVNAERTVRGLPALTQDDQLALAAQRHTEDMVARGFFDHYAPEPAPYGFDPAARISATGYAWSSIGENIAAGYRTPREAMTGWMQSTGHCHNVLSPAFTELGVGATVAAATIPQGTGTWTQSFGRPDGTSAPSADTGPKQGCPYSTLTGIDAAGAVLPPVGGDSSGAGDTTPGGGSPDTSDGGPAQRGANPADAVSLVLGLRHAGRRLTIAGSLAAPDLTRVRIAVKHRGRTVWRGTTALRGGAFRLRLLVPRRATGFTVVVRAGTWRAVRTIA